ncbi:membrane protein [Ascochyta rabiei]|uniref:Membrane protein n=1 Tax=Didymella rabiei TaxID=5454 RepID=A0A163F3W3_DIDRA|nr:membrane protein [Ascochyta rabiei]
MTYSPPPPPPRASRAQPSPLQETPPEPIPEAEDAAQLYKNDAANHTPGFRARLASCYERNLGLVLVFLAQTCGSVMNTAAKLLATGYETKFHAMQIIFIRMLCTTILGVAYMAYNKTPDYSLSWLNISDATVITFVIPTLTALVCFVWLREPFTIREALAALIAFSGVLLVARPTWLFPNPPVDPITGDPEPSEVVANILAFVTSAPATSPTPISPAQRTLAVLAAILGAFGASTAYATIRVIGKRAHSLISVNYFAGIATLGSFLTLLIHPDLHFVMPASAGQWALIAVIGLTGFLLQFLLTEGLQREKAGRATNLMYLQLVFALVIERVIWGTTPPLESLGGAVLIIGAAVWITLQKNAGVKEEVKGKGKVVDEESSLLGRDEEGRERILRRLVSSQCSHLDPCSGSPVDDLPVTGWLVWEKQAVDTLFATIRTYLKTSAQPHDWLATDPDADNHRSLLL